MPPEPLNAIGMFGTEIFKHDSHFCVSYFFYYSSFAFDWWRALNLESHKPQTFNDL